ncbi:hypothetical protein [Methylomonas sp. YC3]
MEKGFQLAKGRIHCRFAQWLAGLLIDLFGQVGFEGNRLLIMKSLEFAIFCVGFKATDGLGYGID